VPVAQAFSTRGGGDARQAQCLGQRTGRLADVVLFEADAEPRGLDLRALDAGVERGPR
jgi:hypothetical protein